MKKKRSVRQWYDLMRELESRCDRAMAGPARSQEHYMAALRDIREMVREARE